MDTAPRRSALALTLVLACAACADGGGPPAARATLEPATAAGCEARGESRAILAWKDGRHYCLRGARAEAAPACSACGVVEAVRPLQRAEAGGGGVHVSGGAANAVIFLLAFGRAQGERRAAAAPAHETTVRLDDGSVRILHLAGAPAAEPGARVRVIQGRIEPIPPATLLSASGAATAKALR